MRIWGLVLKVLPIAVPHGRASVVGYRVGDIAYITDAKELPPSALDAVRGVRVLVINAGGLGQGVAQRLGALPQVEMWKPADLHRILPQSRSGRDSAQTADLRATYRHILLCLPPLIAPGFPVALASIADGSVLLVPWGRVTPDLLR